LLLVFLSACLSACLQDWRNVLLQATSGHVTIYPSPRLRDYVRLLHDPSKEDMVRLTCRATEPSFDLFINWLVMG
jgi:hypothetical protein